MILEFGNITEDMHFLFFFITKDPDHYLKKKGIGKGRKREEDGKKKLVMANFTKMNYGRRKFYNIINWSAKHIPFW